MKQPGWAGFRAWVQSPVDAGLCPKCAGLLRFTAQIPYPPAASFGAATRACSTCLRVAAVGCQGRSYRTAERAVVARPARTLHWRRISQLPGPHARARSSTMGQGSPPTSLLPVDAHVVVAHLALTGRQFRSAEVRRRAVSLKADMKRRLEREFRHRRRTARASPLTPSTLRWGSPVDRHDRTSNSVGGPVPDICLTYSGTQSQPEPSTRRTRRQFAHWTPDHPGRLSVERGVVRFALL